MDVCKLKPATKDYLWGGRKLIDEWNKSYNGDVLAETWELSFHKDGPCIVDSGINKGKLLEEVVTKENLGTFVNTFPFFPVLIKLINSAQNLSVQVHPSDEYALKNENSFGKTEIWYVLDKEEGAGLYVGFNKDYSKEEIEEKLKDGSILSACNFYDCKPGDLFIIESGTIHAIGKGMTVIEIQQNSNLTYRLYDYNRLGADGKPRPLHIEKALNVLDFKKYQRPNTSKDFLCKFKYFSSYKFNSLNKNLIEADETSFISFTIINGNGMVNDLVCNKGDTFFIPAKMSAKLSGDFDFILTKVESKY